MKQYITTILILFTLSASYAQVWVKLDVNTNERLNEIYFISDEEGYIVGDNGLLLKTIDGGASWRKLDVEVSHNLMDIHFATSEIGYINGLKTIDGGATWFPQNPSAIFGLIHCIDENTIIAGHGDSFFGDIYNSVDGGETWTVSANPIIMSTNGNAGMYNDCYFVNETEGYLSAWYSGHLFKTSDAGLSWNEIIINEVDGNNWTSDDFRSVYFPTKEIGLVTHTSGILKTSDAANTWSEIKPENLNFNFYPESIVALSTQHYIAVGGYNNIEIDKIYETIDGGTSWTASVNTIDALFDVECTSTDCFAVGSNGSVYRKDKTVSNNNTLLEDIALKVIPNPSQSFLAIETSLSFTNFNLFNLAGKLLSTYPGTQTVIDISNLKPGLYVVQGNIEGKIFTSRVIKQ